MLVKPIQYFLSFCIQFQEFCCRTWLWQGATAPITEHLCSCIIAWQLFSTYQVKSSAHPSYRCTTLLLNHTQTRTFQKDAKSSKGTQCQVSPFHYYSQQPEGSNLKLQTTATFYSRKTYANPSRIMSIFQSLQEG